MKLRLLVGVTQIAVVVESIVHTVHPLKVPARVGIFILVVSGLFSICEVFLDKHDKTEYLLDELAEYAERAERFRQK